MKRVILLGRVSLETKVTKFLYDGAPGQIDDGLQDSLGRDCSIQADPANPVQVDCN